MAEKRDYYEVLGVTRDADKKAIKDAYRRLARKLHPDVNPDPQAADQFKEVGEAYEVLSDETKKGQYDRLGHDNFAAYQSGGGHPGGGFGGATTINIEDLFGGAAGGAGFEDLFGDFFGAAMGGRGARGQQRRRGADFQHVLEISLEEASKAVSRTLRYKRHVTCENCDGSGGAPGTQPVDCPVCHGQGFVAQSRGFMTFRQSCPKCHGTGQTNPVNCSECNGQGVVEKEEALEIKIPAGVDTNSRVRYEGMGEAGLNGGPPGDLYVIAKVKEHDFFVRKGDNLFCEIPVSLYEAVLGAKIRVPTLNGTSTVNIPAGSSTGDQVTLKGKGIPHLRGWGAGNQVCMLKVVVPQSLTREQKKHFTALRNLDKSDVRKHLKTGS